MSLFFFFNQGPDGLLNIVGTNVTTSVGVITTPQSGVLSGASVSMGAGVLFLNSIIQITIGAGSTSFVGNIVNDIHDGVNLEQTPLRIRVLHPLQNNIKLISNKKYNITKIHVRSDT